MIRALRGWSVRILAFVVRHAPVGSREWAHAMRQELDGIDDDWEALSWAVGCTAALVRHGVTSVTRGAVDERRLSTITWRTVGTTAAQLVAGVVVAGMLVTMCLLGLMALSHVSLVQLGNSPLGQRTMVIAALELQFVISAALLWRARRPMATGILLAAMTLLVHFASHG